MKAIDTYPPWFNPSVLSVDETANVNAPVTNTASCYSDLKRFFDGATLPTTPIKLDYVTVIIDPTRFVKSELAVIKNYEDCHNPHTFKHHLFRLQLLMKILSEKN